MSEEQEAKVKKVATTFNMRTDLRSKAKIYIAYHNQKAEEDKSTPKTDLGKLLNEALDFYLKDVEVE